MVLKDNSSGGSGNNGGGGATWAFEVSGQTMICPIRVEDLNPPGQMLIEVYRISQRIFTISCWRICLYMNLKLNPFECMFVLCCRCYVKNGDSFLK